MKPPKKVKAARKRSRLDVLCSRKDPVDRLYGAVGKYVEANNGSIVVIGGIKIMEWPGDSPMKYSVVVECVGKKPIFKRHTPLSERGK